MKPLKDAPAQFDPLSDVFVAQFARPSHLAAVNLRTLTPFHRALLTLDGTVTKFIEASTLEPVRVRVLRQAAHSLGTEDVWLDAPTGSPVLAREVVLEAEHSCVVRAFAASLIAMDRMPPGFPSGLDAAEKGLGQALMNSSMETRREILWYGREQLARLSPCMQDRTRTSTYLSRTYRVITGGRPVMVINEKFPLDDDPMPTHH